MPEEKTAPERGGNIIEKRMASKSPGLFSHPHGIAMSSFSPPANDAITLRLALLNACLAPCAGRAESVYHIIDGTGKETVRKCRFGNWHISETERLATRLAMEMDMSVRIIACIVARIVARNGIMASAQFVSDAVRPVLDDMDQPGESEQSQGA